VAVAVFTVPLLLVAGCAGPDGTTPGHADGRLREAISASLREQGYAEQANITQDDARLTPVEAAFLRSWRILEVEKSYDHPVLFYVGFDGERALLLTDRPAAFNDMTAADGTRVDDTATAEHVARVYLHTTRPTNALTYVVDNVDQIMFRPGLSAEEAQWRDKIVQRYGPVVRPPAASQHGDAFTVTAYVVQEETLQERTVTVSGSGGVDEQSHTLEDRLPTPYTL
jgi:hypothetical protein